MAGSHAKMSGVIFSPSTINVQNGTSTISGNPQSVTYNGISRGSVNGSVTSFHNSNGLTTAHLFKPGNKIIVQGTSNGTALVVGSCNNARIPMSVTKTVNSILPPPQLSNDVHSNINNIIFKDSKNFIPLPRPFESPLSQLNKEIKEEPVIIKEEPIMVKEELEFRDEPEIITEEADEPVIDIMINNVVCSFSVGCHLDLRNIALSGKNVEFRRENGMVTMKIRRPLTTASIWSSGKITCTGSTSEDESRVAARRIARALQKLGYTVRFRNYRVVNVLGTCTMPFAIKISQFSQKFREAASYEPELHPGVTYRIEHPKATLKIFSTGSITVTAPSVENVQSAIEHIYPLVKEFSKDRSPEELAEMHKSKGQISSSSEVDDSNDDSDDDF